MEAASRRGRILRATLCEIERGVFYATYFQDRSAPDTDELPSFQVGKTAIEAKQRIERNARALGYETVSWKESITVPVFPAHAETAARTPVAAIAARRSA